MTLSPGPDGPVVSHDTDPRSPRRQAEVSGATRRRRRLLIASAALLLVAGLLVVNAQVVARQSAPAGASSTLPLSGGDIYVRQDGPAGAPPLVLIHGLASSSRAWDALVPLLTPSHRVIRIDLLGHGRSAKPAGDGYGMPEQGRRVGAVMDRLGIEHAAVIGHSTGGAVATALAEQRPELVTSLVLIDTAPRLAAAVSSGGGVGGLLYTPVVGQLLWRLRTDSLIRNAASSAFSRPGFAIPQTVVDDARGMTYHALVATTQTGDDYVNQRALPDRLAPLGKPLLVIFGQDDRRWRSSSAAEYRAVPGAKVEVLPGVGHSPIMEDPPRTAALVLAFTAGPTTTAH
ncbi:alpha/beta fold hydrolase [Nonomuraea roseoviolacea]|uniref:Pimeloyl-ACP methyl ester carboxylesterase n=1 Tax=Nonomuraea roseoviolacea subsp. carminata TaxID=160689 RepID=A0ABT1KD25_9ACTN|nr:alpha/beta hydrolase [Nonomuraea roseoviolacea]MCP2351923.1 pimeloyl-ACP methyl ester carboxylesterase [Nonomuraea roseoviolacea subsp. carminata]